MQLEKESLHLMAEMRQRSAVKVVMKAPVLLIVAEPVEEAKVSSAGSVIDFQVMPILPSSLIEDELALWERIVACAAATDSMNLQASEIRHNFVSFEAVLSAAGMALKREERSSMWFETFE